MSPRLLWVNLVLSVLAIAIALWAALRPMPDALVVRSLTVKDANGTPRAILAAPVPDPLVDGKPSGKRAGSSAGLLLADAHGNERGGYITDDGDEALITLDGEKGHEVFKVVGNPDAGASLFVVHGNNAYAMLTTYQGKPELQLFDKDGKLLSQLPVVPARPENKP